MNPTVVTFLGFVVAVLILTWGVIELTSRYTRHNKRQINAGPVNTWVTLKPKAPDTIKAPLSPSDDEDADQDPSSDLHTRAKQNGHYSRSKKPL